MLAPGHALHCLGNGARVPLAEPNAPRLLHDLGRPELLLDDPQLGPGELPDAMALDGRVNALPIELGRPSVIARPAFMDGPEPQVGSSGEVAQAPVPSLVLTDHLEKFCFRRLEGGAPVGVGLDEIDVAEGDVKLGIDLGRRRFVRGACARRYSSVAILSNAGSANAGSAW